VQQSRSSELFTARELEILELLGHGKTSKEMALLLDIGIATIASHRRNICRKLGVHSTAELIYYAVAGQAFRFRVSLRSSEMRLRQVALVEGENQLGSESEQLADEVSLT
jgi:DNA-binding CsgD family transcriptional regulator